ncbi:hypothetical protein [Streptomyces sp. H39-C1]|uniref:hypothetical protein n=1 Tax=Streptomyces sp. H39-C1 TaxID=3004355 RepID=UPI0022AED927|nr:hypothetical protein [Streptomyces sp. H39-C1]MCZ4101076.1 hypothetical protein [Streptomyces sp. H39-C1]
MSDPVDPQGPPDFSALAGPGAGQEQRAWDAIQQVVSWYTAQLMTERRTPVPDAERVEELMAARRAALADQQRLPDAEPREVARLAGYYAQLHDDLKGQ